MNNYSDAPRVPVRTGSRPLVGRQRPTPEARCLGQLAVGEHGWVPLSAVHCDDGVLWVDPGTCLAPRPNPVECRKVFRRTSDYLVEVFATSVEDLLGATTTGRRGPEHSERLALRWIDGTEKDRVPAHAVETWRSAPVPGARTGPRVKDLAPGDSVVVDSAACKVDENGDLWLSPLLGPERVHGPGTKLTCTAAGLTAWPDPDHPYDPVSEHEARQMGTATMERARCYRGTLRRVDPTG